MQQQLGTPWRGFASWLSLKKDVWAHSDHPEAFSWPPSALAQTPGLLQLPSRRLAVERRGGGGGGGHWTHARTTTSAAIPYRARNRSCYPARLGPVVRAAGRLTQSRLAPSMAQRRKTFLGHPPALARSLHPRTEQAV
ncbi:hypothetical protein PVAP13_5KG100100 [Panicum virgatum]|uniref:Uncharacterized protein n=1 Tax=Panicum virgatum TaxID=38727 RepID=A0A8T0SFW1_PANVG|nr:hypothetical protein PVAP13_5KG100100 [Panicum virgatum]